MSKNPLFKLKLSLALFEDQGEICRKTAGILAALNPSSFTSKV